MKRMADGLRWRWSLCGKAEELEAEKEDMEEASEATTNQPGGTDAQAQYEAEERQAALEAQEASSRRPEYDISDDEDDDEIADPPPAKVSSKKGKDVASPAATNYASLGLDDSDSDSD